jgi:hypothetical protein
VLYSGGEWAGFGAVILAAYPHRREPFAVPFHHPDYGPMVFLCVQTDRLAEEMPALLTPENMALWHRLCDQQRGQRAADSPIVPASAGASPQAA